MAPGLITGAPNALLVKGQRKLTTAEEAQAFNDQLSNKLMALEQAGKTNIEFEDFDISQNKMPVEQFESLFATLSTVPVKVTRMKLFGCATLNDQVCDYIASWLGQVTAETAPNEMHLSDCAITADGFNAIVSAMESNDAFPPKTKFGTTPMYMRIEGNYISEDCIKEKLEAGVLGQFKKNPKGGGKGFNEIPEGAKGKLLVSSPGKFAQKEGEPPAPEDAPPPKEVKQWVDWSKEKSPSWSGGSGGNNWWQAPANAGSWGKGGGAKGGGAWGGNSWENKSWPAVPAGGGNSAWKAPAQQAANNWKPQAGKGKAGTTQSTTVLPKAYVPPGKGAAAAGKGATAGKGTAATKGTWNSGGAAASKIVKPGDRSRTPVSRPTPPARGPKALPADWQEEWSEEYQIPFFWNSKTGESVWERPS